MFSKCAVKFSSGQGKEISHLNGMMHVKDNHLRRNTIFRLLRCMLGNLWCHLDSFSRNRFCISLKCLYSFNVIFHNFVFQGVWTSLILDRRGKHPKIPTVSYGSLKTKEVYNYKDITKTIWGNLPSEQRILWTEGNPAGFLDKSNQFSKRDILS